MYQPIENIHYLTEPGEYGRPEAPDGWTVIDLSNYDGKRLFLSSKDFANPLRDYYHIPPNNVVRLNVPPIISEQPLPGVEGLTQFKNKLAAIQNPAEDVLVHCSKGNNRTPVAAYIYMVDRLNIPPQQAKNLVESAMKPRNRNFELNSRGHYTDVIRVVDEQYRKRAQDQPAPSTSNYKRIRESEVRELLEQAERWYGPSRQLK